MKSISSPAGLITSNKKSKSRQLLIGFLFILPAVCTTLLFKYYPIFKALYMSFFEYKTIFNPGKFVFLDQYIYLFSFKLYWKSWSNTVILAFLSISFGFWPPILQAILLSYIKKLQGILRVLYLIPIIVPSVVGAFLWRWIYNPGNGALNSILTSLGFEAVGWLNDPGLVKLSLAIPSLLGGGIAILIYLAAIEGIPMELYEASEIDGVGQWKKIFYITLPGIRSIIGIQFILTIISVLQIFDQPFIMTGGGPIDESRVSTMLVYNYAFQQYKFGLGSAAAMMIFIIIMVITVFQIIYKKEEN